MAANARELERMRALVSRLSDRQLGEMVNEYWSVAGVLGHIAFWDGCALYLAAKLQRGEPFTASENEPGDVDWINDSSRPLIHAIAPRALAELAVSIAGPRSPGLRLCLSVCEHDRRAVAGPRSCARGGVAATLH